MSEDLEKRFRSLEDEDLARILTSDRCYYTAEAIAVATRVVEDRGLDLDEDWLVANNDADEVELAGGVDQGGSGSVVWAIVISCLVLVLVITNPATDDLEDWIYSQLVLEAQQGSGIRQLMTVIGVDRMGAVSFVRMCYRRDYVVFSTYRFRTDNQDLLIIGLLNNFMVLPQKGAM